MVGRGWIGRSKKHSRKKTISQISLEKNSPSTYKSLQFAPISEWGKTRARWTTFLLSWPPLYRADFLQNNILKRTIFGGCYCETARSQYSVMSTNTYSQNLPPPTWPQYRSLFSCFWEFIKKERTTITCLPFSNRFSIRKRHIPNKIIVRHLHTSRNKPCWPPKFCISIVFNFFLREFKKSYAKF